MIKFINNINEVKRMGEYYIKEEDKQLMIDCKAELIRVYDILAKTVYRKKVKEWDSSQTFREIAKKVNTCKSLVQYLAFQSDFEFREMKKNEIFNPFFKEITGVMEFKLKNEKFTKAQIKKILKHKDTVVIRQSEYTDDYYYDYLKNYNEGMEIDKIDMLKEVDESFKSACDYKDGEISIFTVGYSYLTKIKNKNIKIIA